MPRQQKCPGLERGWGRATLATPSPREGHALYGLLAGQASARIKFERPSPPHANRAQPYAPSGDVRQTTERRGADGMLGASARQKKTPQVLLRGAVPLNSGRWFTRRASLSREILCVLTKDSTVYQHCMLQN